MHERLWKDARSLNVVQEVGRDPLRVPVNTPPEQVIEVARKLGAAKELLKTVLPQPIRPESAPSEILSETE